MSLQVFIQNYNHCENNPCTCKRISDAGIALIRSIYCKTYHLKEELYFNFKNSEYFFLSEAIRVMEEVRWELSRSEYYQYYEQEESKEPIINVENCYIYENKQSFYSFDVCKRIRRQAEIDRLINKVLLPFLYYSISEHQNQSSKKV